MVLAPLFIGFFMFPATRQWGMNWISKMLYFCFIYILVIAIVRFGFLAFSDTINMAASLDGPSVLATSKQITQLIIVESVRSEEHTSALQSRGHIVCRLLL